MRDDGRRKTKDSLSGVARLPRGLSGGQALAKMERQNSEVTPKV